MLIRRVEDRQHANGLSQTRFGGVAVKLTLCRARKMQLSRLCMESTDLRFPSSQLNSNSRNHSTQITSLSR